MTPHLNRRAALIAAGQGMAAVLLAACGTSVDRSAPPTSTAGTMGGAPVPRTSPVGGTAAARVATPEVTVPAFAPTDTSTGTRTLLPLTSTSASTSNPTRTTAHPGSTEATAHASTSGAAGTTSTGRPAPSPTSAPGHLPAEQRSTAAGPGDTTASAAPTRSAPSRTAPTGTSGGTPTTGTGARRRGSSGQLAGRVVAIDPGHNGGNGAHPEIINQLVDGGYGQRNKCNTTGTETDAGYPEHQFTWQVAGYLRPLLESAGITVVTTRSSDTGVGPCTNVRAAIENRAAADAVVSIHGDGAPASVRGFYVLTATRPPAGASMAARSLLLASSIADAAVANGFPPSNTLGSGGLWQRDDLTGLNLSMRPKILIECGNMRNATEAELMSSGAGQQRYAQALADGIVSYLKNPSAAG